MEVAGPVPATIARLLSIVLSETATTNQSFQSYTSNPCLGAGSSTGVAMRDRPTWHRNGRRCLQAHTSRSKVQVHRLKMTLMQGNHAKIHIKRTTSLHALCQADIFIRRLEIREAGKSQRHTVSNSLHKVQRTALPSPVDAGSAAITPN